MLLVFEEESPKDADERALGLRPTISSYTPDFYLSYTSIIYWAFLFLLNVLHYDFFLKPTTLVFFVFVLGLLPSCTTHFQSLHLHYLCWHVAYVSFCTTRFTDPTTYLYLTSILGLFYILFAALPP